MALFIKQDVEKTELQTRLAAELREKAKKISDDFDRPDGVDDSQYIRGLKTTTSLAGIWLLILLSFVIIAIWLMITSLAL